MATITGTSGNNSLKGTRDADKIYGLAGDDGLSGDMGNDELDGGAGNDVVNGNTGNDLLIYVANENTGFTDVYNGGTGADGRVATAPVDTLRLVLTRAEWLNPLLQTDIKNLLQFIKTNT